MNINSNFGLLGVSAFQCQTLIEVLGVYAFTILKLLIKSLMEEIKPVDIESRKNWLSYIFQNQWHFLPFSIYRDSHARSKMGKIQSITVYKTNVFDLGLDERIDDFFWRKVSFNFKETRY